MGSSTLTLFEEFEHAFMSGNTLGQKFTDNEILAVQQSNNKTRDSDTNRSKNRTKTVRREVRCLLFRDIMSIVTGLRPAVLLDYLIVTTNLMVQIDNLWRGIRVLLDRVGNQDLSECCLVIVDHTCIIIARTDHLLDSNRLPFPLCVGFGLHDDDGVFKAYWLDGEERNRLMKQIELLRTSIMRITEAARDNCLACKQQQHTASSSSSDSSSLKQVHHFSAAALDHTCPVVVDLESLMMDEDQFDLLQMPTVNGWLLGYPLTYHVKSIEHAEKIRRFLSSTTLSWYSVRTDLRFQIKDETATTTTSLTEKKKIQLTIDHIHRTVNITQLLGFSVPQYLIDEESKESWNVVIEKWKNDLIASANTKHHQQRYWTEPQLFVESRMTGVLL